VFSTDFLGRLEFSHGSYHHKSVVLYTVFFYIRYGVFYRDLEEVIAERGVGVDHATLNRWVVKYRSWVATKYAG